MSEAIKRLEKIAEELLEIAESLSPGKSPPARSSRSKLAEEPDAPEAEDTADVTGDLESMTRPELLSIAKGLGIDTGGKKMDELRELIRGASSTKKGPPPARIPPTRASRLGPGQVATGSTPPRRSGLSSPKPASSGGLSKAAPSRGRRLPPLAVKLETFLGNNYADYADVLDGDRDPENGILGCGGTCTNCPFPEAASPDEQIAMCYETVRQRIEAEDA